MKRFSADNNGYKIERNNRGDITIMSPGYAPETLDRAQAVAAIAPVAGFVLDCTPLWS